MKPSARVNRITTAGADCFVCEFSRIMLRTDILNRGDRFVSQYIYGMHILPIISFEHDVADSSYRHVGFDG